MTSRPWWTRAWWTGVVAVVLAAVLLFGEPARAQDDPDADWERLPLPNPRDFGIDAIYTPASGPLFVSLTFPGMYRSDDAGLSWSLVPKPDRTGVVGMDPADHTIVYLRGPGGLYRSVRGSETPELVINTSDSTRFIAGSQGDPHLVYAAMHGTGRARLLRSVDRGATWAGIEELAGEGGCGPIATLLYPHPSQTDRLFYHATCSGRTGPVRESLDRGATWRETITLASGTSYGMTGGFASAPERLYLFTRDAATGRQGVPYHSVVLRTDGDGTWTEIARFERAYIGGLVADPADPDRLYVGLYSHRGFGARTSGDGGLTWTDLGVTNPGEVTALALGIDGRYLYAANREHALLRLRLL